MTSPPEVEKNAGLELYITESHPCGAKLRSTDEDFHVEEVLKKVGVSLDEFPGSFALYRVEKRSIDTLHLARQVGTVLRSRVSYAGIKDKRAVAVQFLSPTSSRNSAPRSIEGQGFKCELVGYMRRPLSPNMVAGNSFRILLRDCCPSIGDSIASTLNACEEGRVPNFYGLQRFGTRDSRTYRIGKALVKADFREAVKLLLLEPRVWDDDAAKNARELMSAGRFDEGLRLLPRGQDVERMAARSLSKRPGDYLGAIRSVPIALRRLYVQALQSYLFNRTVSQGLREGLDISKAVEGDNWGEVSTDGLSLRKVHGVREPMVGIPVPLVQIVGYAYRNYGSRFDRCADDVLRAEGVSAKEFYVKEMQEVSAEGGFRRAHLTVRGASWGVSGDTAELRFTLPRGEYATVLLREVVKPPDPSGAGFD